MRKNLGWPARDPNTISAAGQETEFIYSDYSWGELVQKSRLSPDAFAEKRIVDADALKTARRWRGAGDHSRSIARFRPQGGPPAFDGPQAEPRAPSTPYDPRRTRLGRRPQGRPGPRRSAEYRGSERSNFSTVRTARRLSASRGGRDLSRPRREGAYRRRCGRAIRLSRNPSGSRADRRRAASARSRACSLSVRYMRRAGGSSRRHPRRSPQEQVPQRRWPRRRHSILQA